MRTFILGISLLITFSSKAQNWAWQLDSMENLPEPVSNNAVCEGWANDTGYVYSFGGIDSTKIWSGIHLRSFRYNTITNIWDTIPTLPDTLGKIAAAASWVDSIIYIIGGYHVYGNHNEASSAKVHRFDPRTNTYLSDGADIPIPIDDHVQAVWNDSLIYVITGWSNTGNVPNVQIYDPANDTWYVGDPLPTSSLYMAFGASGSIVGNTIYYHGGSRSGFNFPAQSIIRIGQINPKNPLQISWSSTSTSHTNYRPWSLTDHNGLVHFIGGSGVSYNYNGIAYNGSGGVNPHEYAYYYDTINNSLDTAIIISNTIKLPMDLRGSANFLSGIPTHNKAWFLAGGMEKNQTVSNKTIRLTYQLNVSGININDKVNFIIYPNPTSSQINLLFDEINDKTIYLTDVIGNVILQLENNSNNIQLDLSNYPKGIYFVRVESQKNSSTQKIILQ